MLTDFLSYWASNETIQQRAIGSVVVLAVALLLRSAGLKAVRSMSWTNEGMRLRWHMRVRHVSMSILVLGFVIIWATQLRSLALSAVAIAAALVLATRELLLCFSGSFLRTATEAYSVGDRIEISGVRGVVTNYGPLGTTLLEIGAGHHRTGRMIVVPNSRLLSEHVINETATHDYILHVITIPLSQSDDWQAAEASLLTIANDVCDEFIEKTREKINRSSVKHGLPKVQVEPHISLHIPEPGKLHLLLRIPCPAFRRGPVEQQILRRFFRHEE